MLECYVKHNPPKYARVLRIKHNPPKYARVLRIKQH